MVMCAPTDSMVHLVSAHVRTGQNLTMLAPSQCATRGRGVENCWAAALETLVLFHCLFPLHRPPPFPTLEAGQALQWWG